MTNILEICKQHNIELANEKAFESAVLENYITRAEHDKKLSKAEADRDKWKTQAENAEETLKGFEGIDPQKIQQEISDWKAKVENAERDYQAKLEEREFEDILKTALGEIKFSSESAKKAIAAEVRAAGLKVRNGQILGFNDLIEGLKKTDAAAFAGDVPPASFSRTASHDTSGVSGKKLSEMSLDERMALRKNNPERYNALKKGN